MTLNRLFVAATAALLSLSVPVFAEGIMIKDAYVRSSTPSSPTGAAYLVIENHEDVDDRLIGASSGMAKRVELHTHTEDANGVMRMGEIEGGIALPAGGRIAMKRGGQHVMLMGLTELLVQGEDISVTLRFEKAGEVKVTIPVDQERKPDHGASDHSEHSHDS